MFRGLKNRRGLTFLELLFNIAILALLFALAIPAYMTFKEKAKTVEAKSDWQPVINGETGP